MWMPEEQQWFDSNRDKRSSQEASYVSSAQADLEKRIDAMQEQVLELALQLERVTDLMTKLMGKVCTH